MLWDPNYVYVLIEVTDPNGTHASSTNHYETDTVEVFYDGNNHKSSAYEADDIQCRIGYDNSKTVSDNHSTSDFISAAKDNGNGYIVEMAIPSAVRGLKYETGDCIGFDVQINDDDGTGARVGISNWSGDTTGLGYTTTQYLGVLMLSGEVDESLYDEKGDVNTDGSVDLKDAVLLAKAVASLSTLSTQGAINAELDGKTGLAGGDLTVLLQYLAGTVKEL